MSLPATVTVYFLILLFLFSVVFVSTMNIANSNLKKVRQKIILFDI
ncbi:MAG: hypothetical protein LBK82_10010 [Planctomycetaceae bacterium]|nr:hypothetical protein [Planctomycetaceae bacterium]